MTLLVCLNPKYWPEGFRQNTGGGGGTGGGWSKDFEPIDDTPRHFFRIPKKGYVVQKKKVQSLVSEGLKTSAEVREVIVESVKSVTTIDHTFKEFVESVTANDEQLLEFRREIREVIEAKKEVEPIEIVDLFAECFAKEREQFLKRKREEDDLVLILQLIH